MPALARNVGQVAYSFSQQVARGTSPHLTLSLNDGDTTMVDLSDATYPKVIEAGVYAFTLVISQTLNGDQSWAVTLLVDDNYYSITATIDELVPPGGWPARSVSATWWCDAADPFAVRAQVDVSGAADPTFAGSVYVQRIR